MNTTKQDQEKQDQDKPKSVFVICRFVRCEKYWYRSGKAGRYYRLIFEVTETAPGGPAVGTEVVRKVWGAPHNLFDSKVTGSPGLVNLMQQLSPQIHTPEQLRTESWEIVVNVAVRWEIDKGSSYWAIVWFDRPATAFERQPGPTVEATNEGGTNPGDVEVVVDINLDNAF